MILLQKKSSQNIKRDDALGKSITSLHSTKSVTSKCILQFFCVFCLCALQVCHYIPSKKTETKDPFSLKGLPEQRGVFSEEGCGEAKCKMGEGDCDSNDDCVEGLICEHDGWWGLGLGTDYCRSGTLVNIVIVTL